MALNNKYQVSAGELRLSVTFQNNHPAGNNSSGGPGDDNYTDLLTTRCKLVNNSGNKRLDTGEIVFVNSWQMITRFQAALETGVNIDTRCIIGGNAYRIVNFGLTDMTKHYYYFNLSVNG